METSRLSRTRRNNIGKSIESITTPYQIPPQQRSAGRLFTYRAKTSAPRAYQGANTLCMYMIWMWDPVHRALEPQT